MALNREDLQRALDAVGHPWNAVETELVRLAGLPGSNVFGLSFADPEATLADAQLREDRTGVLAADIPVPRSVDWREEGLVTRVKDQGTCGACVAFAMCAALESRALIHFAVELDLSEAHLFHCGNPGGCGRGWQPDDALSWARRPGVGLEADFPYTAGTQCRTVAPAVAVPRWSAAVSLEQRKRTIAFNGPAVGGMRVFDDLPYYESGIYRHVAGGERALHAVAVVGYDDDGGHWIVKNSWGEHWGEGGYLRIAYGECGLDSEFPFYDPDLEIV